MASSGSTETQVWKTVSENPGSTAAQLGPKLKSVTKKDLVSALNALLAKDLVKVSKTSDNQLVWKAVDIGDAKAKNAMAGDDRMVFSAIEASGNQGIWSRTITSQTNLPNAVVTKIITKLISSKQIKMVKSVKHPTRKMYMAAHIEPSVDLTGGPWYTDFELDPTFIGFVRGACLKFVQKKSFPDPEDDSPTAPLFPCTTSTDRYPTIHDITRFIKSAKITEVNLLPEHIEEVMNVLIYEGVIEKLPGTGGPSRSKTGGSDSEDDDDENTIKKNGKPGKKRRKAPSDGEDDGEEAEMRRKRRKKGKRTASDSDSDDGGGYRSRQSSSRKRGQRDSGFSSGSDVSNVASKRGRKRRRDRSSSSDDSDDQRSRSASSKRRWKRSGRSSKRRNDSDTMGTVSSDETDDASESDAGKRRKKSSQSRKEDDAAHEDVDLDAAFGHLFGGGSVYRAIRQERVGLGWSQAPCGRCPQLEFCEDNGPVNPTGCKYYGDWLNQTMGD